MFVSDKLMREHQLRSEVPEYLSEIKAKVAKVGYIYRSTATRFKVIV
jgi:hypothetical protein